MHFYDSYKFSKFTDLIFVFSASIFTIYVRSRGFLCCAFEPIRELELLNIYRDGVIADLT
jgi:hypothetical protein